MNYYQTLDIPEDATLKEIKKKFYELSVRFHPDKNPNDKYSEEKYKKLSAAFTVLSNYNQRKLYDSSRQSFDNLNDQPLKNMDRLLSINRVKDDSLLLMNGKRDHADVNIMPLLQLPFSFF